MWIVIAIIVGLFLFNFILRGGALDNYTMIARNVTYACEAVRAENSNADEYKIWLAGASIATLQYMKLGQISHTDLEMILSENLNDFVGFVSGVMIAEFMADSPAKTLQEALTIARAVESQREKITVAINRAKADFPTSSHNVAQTARRIARATEIS